MLFVGKVSPCFPQAIVKGKHLIQVIQVPKPPLAPIAVIWRMLFIPVVLKSFLGLKDERTIIAAVPMLSLLVFQAKLSVVSWPSSETPAAFDFISMAGTVIEVVADGVIGIKGAATALIHRVHARER